MKQSLYAQNTPNRIEIVVKKDDNGGSSVGAKETTSESVGGGSQTNGGGSSSNITTWRTAIFGSESPQRIKRVVKTNITHAWAVSKQMWGLAVSYYVGGQGYTSGDQAYQEAVQRQMEIVEDTTSIASSVAMGALYGSWGGPIGAISGAVLNGTSTAVSISAKYKNRERDFNYKMFKEENSIEYKRARANISLTNGRLR